MKPDREAALGEAVAYTLGDPRERGDACAHPALLAMLRSVDADTAAADVAAAGSDLLGVPFDANDGAPVLASLYAALETISAVDAAAILSAQARPCAFRYDDSASPLAELAELLDAKINAVLVAHLMSALNGAIEHGEIARDLCLRITHLILEDSDTRTNPAYLAALEQSLRVLHEKAPGTPVIYLSIGCGSGREDAGIVASLRRTFPDQSLEVIGFDPFQKNPEGHPIVTELGGTLVNRELRPGETFVSLVREITGAAEPAILATERYALHHMGRSPSCFLREIEGAALVSVEEPVSPLQRTSLDHRLAASGYDILANHALEQRFGGSWITEARKNPALFGSLYRRIEALESQRSRGVATEKIEGVWPATYVIRYPPKGSA